MIGKFMRQLEQELSMAEPFEASSAGVYEYLLREDLSILISPIQALDGKGVQFFARLGAVPAEGGDAFFTHMLAGNLYGEMTHEGVLGLEPDGKQMVLSRAASGQIKYGDFRLMLEDFINTALTWREEAGLPT